MPRPRPLTLASAVRHPQDGQLTPRTPHSNIESGSRTSRLEQGFSKVQISGDDDGDFESLHDTLQSAPLLASSTSAQFPLHERPSGGTKPHKTTRGGKSRFIEVATLVVERLPLAIGIIVAGVLLILILLSLTRPEELHRYIGAKAPSSNKPVSTVKSSAAHESAHKSSFISYANYTTFPLHPNQYADECLKLNSASASHGSYWSTEAPSATLDVEHRNEAGTCSSTITYMLDGYAGLAADLSLLAQVSALARMRHRTLLIDDTYWNRGKWTDHFEDVRKLQPGPEPNCKPPPPSELVACPRNAQHWLINSRTAKFHFGQSFLEEYQDRSGTGLNKVHPIFRAAETSFQSTIRPNPHNLGLIKTAREELSAFLRQEGAETYLAAHIRRGDHKSAHLDYPSRRVPLSNYLEGVQHTWLKLHKEDARKQQAPVYFASDSRAAFEEFKATYKGPVFSIFSVGDQVLRELASPGEYFQSEFASLDSLTRTRSTRGMILDLALISGLWPTEKNLHPDATICAISSNVCKLVPVGLGWSNAFGDVTKSGDVDFEHNRWVDVDQKEAAAPTWSAFELF